jgi:hypothetical protein
MNWPSSASRLAGRAGLVVRPGRKTGIRRAARREREAIVRVGQGRRAGRAGEAGGGGRPVAKLTAVVAVIVAVAVAAVDSREDILRTVRSITGQGQARSGYRD